MDDLLKFACSLIEENDGAVEWHDSRNSFEALLPEDVQHHLGFEKSFITISDMRHAGAETDSIPIGFGTELLERAVPMAINTGRTASVCMPPPSGRKRSDPDPGRYFNFPNATFKVKGYHECRLDYWLWSFDIAADADERREEVYHVCVSSSGTGCEDLPKLILDQASEWQSLNVKASEFSEKTLNRLFIVACDRVLRRVDESLAGFKERVSRHYSRDIHRIETYFQDMSNEMEEEIQRRKLTGSELEIRKEKMKQLSGEKSRKLSALKEKYRLRLTLRPLALLLARVPVRRCDILVKRRKGERQLSLVYNLLSKGFDPLVCEACGTDTYTLGFCDDALHLLCASCMSIYANQKTCLRCQGKRPPSEIKGVLGRLNIEERRQRQA